MTAERSWPRTCSTHSGAREVDDSGGKNLVSTRWVPTEEKLNDVKSKHDVQVEVAGDGNHICCYTSVGIADLHLVAVPIAQEYITLGTRRTGNHCIGRISCPKIDGLKTTSQDMWDNCFEGCTEFETQTTFGSNIATTLQLIEDMILDYRYQEFF